MNDILVVPTPIEVPTDTQSSEDAPLAIPPHSPSCSPPPGQPSRDLDVQGDGDVENPGTKFL